MCSAVGSGVAVLEMQRFCRQSEKVLTVTKTLASGFYTSWFGIDFVFSVASIQNDAVVL